MDDMANKKYQIMVMIFDAGKSLRAEDIAEKVSFFPARLELVLRENHGQTDGD